MNYKIIGDNLPAVICELERGESIRTEGGAMSWMSPNISMNTEAGGIGKAFGRALSGDSIFQNIYTAENGKAMIAFSSCFPGSIHAIEITPDKPIIAQKSSFLAAEMGVELSIYIQKKAISGLFSGEGFILQKLSGKGIAFIEIDGSVVEYDLADGEQLVIDSGNLAMAESTCNIDVQLVKGIKNKLFGGEGFFNTIVTGPGKVMVQTMPASSVASALRPYIQGFGK